MILITQAWPLLVFIAGFQLKHFVCDGPLQTLAMVKSKAIYGDHMGLVHAAIHGVGTLFVLACAGSAISTMLFLAALDFIIHYHVDYGKENIVKHFKWTTLDAKFWWALSADQTLHQLTYLGLVALALTAA